MEPEKRPLAEDLVEESSETHEPERIVLHTIGAGLPPRLEPQPLAQVVATIIVGAIAIAVIVFFTYFGMAILDFVGKVFVIGIVLVFAGSLVIFILITPVVIAEWIFGRKRVDQIQKQFFGQITITLDSGEHRFIPRFAYLRGMISIAWSSIRHPMTISFVDFSTGRVLVDEQR